MDPCSDHLRCSALLCSSHASSLTRQGLWLGGNQLEQLPEEVGQLTALRQLVISGNCIKAL